MTPIQLHFEGLHHLESSEADDQTSTLADRDVDPTLLPQYSSVQVPRHSFLPCHSLLQVLSVVQPLNTCLDHGRSLYIRVIHIVGDHLQTDCSQCTV